MSRERTIRKLLLEKTCKLNRLKINTYHSLRYLLTNSGRMAFLSQLHLATCTDSHPHVSLMNYTYLPSSPYSSSPAIIMTTNPGSKKYDNLVANPNVSLLVHDCELIRISIMSRPNHDH